MSDDIDTSVDDGSSTDDTQDAGTENIEQENGEATSGSLDVDPELLDPKRHKDLQAWATKLATENSELRKAVTQVLQQQGKAPAGDEPQPEKVNAYVEQMIKEKGPAAIAYLADEIAQARIGPLYQKLQQLELASSDPDYVKLRERIDGIYSDTASGKLNVDQVVLRLAKAEAAMEQKGKGGQASRRPDSPERGGGIGNKGGSGPSTAGNKVNFEDMDGTALAKAALADPATTPGIREIILTKHPELRPK